ncbi:hypothetical protein CCL09_23360, partial [Pseudomonas congelans]
MKNPFETSRAVTWWLPTTSPSSSTSKTSISAGRHWPITSRPWQESTSRQAARSPFIFLSSPM